MNVSESTVNTADLLAFDCRFSLREKSPFRFSAFVRPAILQKNARVLSPGGPFDKHVEK
jgi:hypothetical protein